MPTVNSLSVAALNQAITDAINSTTDKIVTFAPGLNGSITLGANETININGEVTIDGGNRVTLDGGGVTRVISIGNSGDVVLKNISIVNGLVEDERGGGIDNNGDLELDGVTVDSNTVRNTLDEADEGPSEGGQDDGGGIYNRSGSNLTIKDSTISNNTLEKAASTDDAGNGPAIRNQGTITFEGDNFVFGNTPGNANQQIAGKGTIIGTFETEEPDDGVKPDVSVSVTPDIVQEGEVLTFTATLLSGAQAEDGDAVAIALAGGTANLADFVTGSVTGDLSFANGQFQLDFAAGQTVATGTVSIATGDGDDFSETASFNFTSGEFTVQNPSDSVTIVDENENLNGSLTAGTNGAVGVTFGPGQDALQISIEQLALDGIEQIKVFKTDSTGAVLEELKSVSLLPAEGELGEFSQVLTVDGLTSDDFFKLELIGPDGTVVGSPSAVDGDTFNFSFGDTVVQANLASFGGTVARGALKEDANGDEFFDLSNNAGTLTATINIYREAAFDNLVGFYEMEAADGSVRDALGNLLMPGDAGYKDAALLNKLDFTVSTGNGQVTTTTVSITGGGFLGTYLISDGTDPAMSDVFFSHAGANGGNDHMKVLGDNTFGFEDQAGLGDADFNDVIVQIGFA